MTDTEIDYFNVIEEHFRFVRGTPLFMFSPVDWALIDAWKNAGIPIEAVLRGIDVAFERWRKRKSGTRLQLVNTLSYCSQAVAEEAQAMANASPSRQTDAKAPFELADVRKLINNHAARLRDAGYGDLARDLESLDLEALPSDFEELEQRLTSIEERMIALLRDSVSDERLSEARCAVDRDLKPYRNKMTKDQLAMLERQFLERYLLAAANLPRLSLFYL